MNTHLNNHIFVDLDETLIHCWPSNEFEKIDGHEKLVKAIKLSDNQIYHTQLRPNAVEFLNELRKITSNVFMLTIATKEYAVSMNRIFGLGFFSDMIYSREDIQRNSTPEVGCGNVFLIDNLPKRENRNKIYYLRPLGPLTYIQAPTYTGGAQGFDGYLPTLTPHILNRVQSSLQQPPLDPKSLSDYSI